MSRAGKLIGALALIVLAYRLYARVEPEPVEYDADPVHGSESVPETA